MATLISQIIQDAYREANIIAVETSPTSDQTTEGLRLLNRFIRSLFGNEVGQPLVPVPYGENNVEFMSQEFDYYSTLLNYFVPVNSRIIANLESTKTINLAPNPEDGDRIGVSDASGNFATYNLVLNGNGRTIDGASTLTLSTNGEDVEYFYREDIADWVQITNLTDTDNSPFPTEFDDLLIIGLAMRLAPRYGSTTAGESINTYRSILTKFRARYGSSEEIRSELGLIKTPLMRSMYGWPYADNYFNKGIPFGY